MGRAVVFMNPVPSKSPQISCFKFLKVISPYFDNISVISSSLDENEDADIYNVKYKKQSNKILRVLNFLWFQLKVFFLSFSKLKKGDCAFFWVGDKMFSSMLACKLKGAKTYFFLYGITSLENDSKKALTTKKGQDFLASKADFLCCESPSVLSDRGIKLDENIKIIHLYVDDLGIAEKKNSTVGMLCRLASGKCVLESIEAFTKFHSVHPKHSLDIVGDGLLYDECKNLIEKLSAQSYITLHGWILHENLFSLMENWSLLLFPTKAEGLPNSVLESMSMAVPSLCSPVGGLKDLIIDKENGYFLENEDVDTIYNALRDVVEGGTLDYVSKNAKETINNEYTLKKARLNFKSQMGF